MIVHDNTMVLIGLQSPRQYKLYMLYSNNHNINILNKIRCEVTSKMKIKMSPEGIKMENREGAISCYFTFRVTAGHTNVNFRRGYL